MRFDWKHMKFERKDGINSIRCYCGRYCGNLMYNPWVTRSGKWFCVDCNRTYTDREVYKLLPKKDKKRFMFWWGCHMPKHYKENPHDRWN